MHEYKINRTRCTCSIETQNKYIADIIYINYAGKDTLESSATRISARQTPLI